MGVPATTVARKGAQEWWLELEMAMTRLVGMEKAHSSGSELGSVTMVAPLWCSQSASESLGEREREQRVSE